MFMEMFPAAKLQRTGKLYTGFVGCELIQGIQHQVNGIFMLLGQCVGYFAVCSHQRLRNHVAPYFKRRAPGLFRHLVKRQPVGELYKNPRRVGNTAFVLHVVPLDALQFAFGIGGI